MDEKKFIEAFIEAQQEILIDLSTYLYENPEMAYKEYLASQKLADVLGSYGFLVEKPYGGLETSFCATFTNGVGPTIGVLAEYDALSNGHSCGHNIIASSGVGAGLALKEVMKQFDIKGTVKVIGTPAEETGGGKIDLLDNHAFDDLDAALLLHPTTGMSKVAGRCKSSYSLEVTYTGQVSSAISRPENGINATEASVLAYQSLANALRYLPNDVSIMPFITTANQNDGLLPVTSTLLVTITAFEDESLEKAIDKVREVLIGSSVVTGTQYQISDLPGYKGRVINTTIGNLLRDNMEFYGEEIMPGFVDDSGFEDFGNVNRVIPGAMVYPTINPEKKVSNHTEEFLKLADPKRSYDTILLGSKVMASTGLDLLRQPHLLDEAKKELER